MIVLKIFIFSYLMLILVSCNFSSDKNEFEKFSSLFKEKELPFFMDSAFMVQDYNYKEIIDTNGVIPILNSSKNMAMYKFILDDGLIVFLIREEVINSDDDYFYNYHLVSFKSKKYISSNNFYFGFEHYNNSFLGRNLLIYKENQEQAHKKYHKYNNLNEIVIQEDGKFRQPEHLYLNDIPLP